MRTEYRDDPTVDTADLPYGWHKGDTCVMITNKAKKSTSEYIVESYDGVYFGVRSHTGYITGYLRGGYSGRKRRPLKSWQSRNMEAYRFRNHSILCWFSNG
mgnify:FL=1